MAVRSLNELQKLIAEKRGDRTLARLSRDCGGVPTERALSRLTLHPFTRLPDKATIEGLARGLGVSVSQVILACAASMGFRVHQEDRTDLVLPGAGNLPPQAQEALLNMSRELQNAYAQPWGQQEESAEYPPLRLAANKGHTGINPEETEPST